MELKLHLHPFQVVLNDETGCVFGTHRLGGFRVLPLWPRMLLPDAPGPCGRTWRQDADNVFLIPFRALHLPNNTIYYYALCGYTVYAMNLDPNCDMICYQNVKCLHEAE